MVSGILPSVRACFALRYRSKSRTSSTASPRSRPLSLKYSERLNGAYTRISRRWSSLSKSPSHGLLAIRSWRGATVTGCCWPLPPGSIAAGLAGGCAVAAEVHSTAVTTSTATMRMGALLSWATVQAPELEWPELYRGAELQFTQRLQDQAAGPGQ